jgi:hypothetical protein
MYKFDGLLWNNCHTRFHEYMSLVIKLGAGVQTQTDGTFAFVYVTQRVHKYRYDSKLFSLLLYLGEQRHLLLPIRILQIQGIHAIILHL